MATVRLGVSAPYPWRVTMRIKPFFRWYDFWIGVYVDMKNRTVYICPLPMVGVALTSEDDDDV